MFICTANMLDTIPAPLLDRMELIRLPGYTEQEKVKIGRRYILPRQIEENGLKKDDVSISDLVLARVIRDYTREAGLRNFEREVGSVCRKLARRKAEGRVVGRPAGGSDSVVGGRPTATTVAGAR